MNASSSEPSNTILFRDVVAYSPTVTQLQEKGWFAVQSIVDKKSSADIMDKLAEVRGLRLR